MAGSDNQISLTEAADRLGVHYMTAYRYVRTGRLPAHKEGGEWRVAVEDLEALRAAGRATAGDGGAPAGRRRRTDYAGQLEERLVHGDEAGAWALLEAAMTSGMSPDEVYRRAIAPAMASIGARWERAELTVDQEHLASNVVLRLIGRLGPRFARRGRKRGTIVVGAPPGDAHGIPTAMAADLLRNQGFEVVDLGADVPAPSFAHAVRGAQRLVAVGVCATSPDNTENIQDALTAIRAATDAPVVLGGNGIADEAQAEALGATWHTSSTDDLLARFEAIATAGTA